MPRTPALRAQSLTSRPRRVLLKAGSTLLLSAMGAAPARAAQIVGVRVWPAEDYTRVTLENDSNLKTTHFLVKDPERMVVDIEGIDVKGQERIIPHEIGELNYAPDAKLCEGRIEGGLADSVRAEEVSPIVHHGRLIGGETCDLFLVTQMVNNGIPDSCLTG